MEEIRTRQEYAKNVTLADGIVVLEGTATWCSQCKAIAPFVEKLIKKYPDARFYNYDTDHTPDIAHELGVNAMPTFHIFRDGDVAESVTGAKAAALERALKSVYKGKVEEDVDTT